MMCDEERTQTSSPRRSLYRPARAILVCAAGAGLIATAITLLSPAQPTPGTTQAPSPQPTVVPVVNNNAGEETGTGTSQSEISFSRDIRPILSDKCFSCHGPDNEHRQAELRLDVTEDGDDFSGAYFAIEPGDPDASDLIERIHSTSARTVMPPPESALTLTDEEKALLRQWIEEGAEYKDHWAYEPPVSQPLPEVADAQWSRNGIDRFVLARLEEEGLSPSPEADRETLIRRLTLDLTGLPPTTAEIQAFISDESASAYENLVDRLLSSPHFGERMALPWLDASRYADTNGFSIDDHRDMWLWREWVIDAFNRNMPYDQFVVEQLAGDLLPNATQQQQLATGFLRNSMNTHEGGTIPEEYRVIYIADKIDAVSSVFLGLTMRCAQCHDHKYDPLSHREYYQFYAFFDTAHEPGKGANNGNTEPIIRMDGAITDNAMFRSDLEQRIATLRSYQMHPPELVEPRAAWEAQAITDAEGELATAINTPAAERTDAQWTVINDAFKPNAQPLWDRHFSTINREIAVLNRDLEAGQPSVMVMREQGPRQTFVLTRGDYANPDEEQPVSADVPAVLPPMQGEGVQTRLDLAQWLMSPDHPLTSRVAVNRHWQMVFGRGLVATLNDFGSQGAYPTHPELLDWLAMDFIDNGWDTKRLIKMMVMSATYRQASAVTPELLELDPNNELLARATRLRLPAEFVRDGALAIAGQLDTRIGGPSVYPAQPHGLWREVSHFGYGNAFSAQAFYPSDESGLTRRSMYTFWKRTSPPPSLSAFDAPSREVCTVQRSLTNTPLQALVLLNDPEYFEAARCLATLADGQAGDTAQSRIDFMFRRATARLPEPAERTILMQQYASALERFAADSDAAQAVSHDGSAQHAAWTVVASTILNLDETITRE